MMPKASHVYSRDSVRYLFDPGGVEQDHASSSFYKRVIPPGLNKLSVRTQLLTVKPDHFTDCFLANRAKPGNIV